MVKAETKMLVALGLDAVDMIVGNIPGVNTVWDFVTIGTLLIVLDNKKYALLNSWELFMPGIPGTGQVDALFPTALLTAYLDEKAKQEKGVK